MRKPALCICINEGEDKLRSNLAADQHRAADQRHCFRFIDSTIPLQPKSETILSTKRNAMFLFAIFGVKNY